MNTKKQESYSLPGMPQADPKTMKGKKASQDLKFKKYWPEKLGKAIRLKAPDFSDPNRPLTCLEADFPIAQINALSNLEGNAGKPIYQMSKWWARRRSSVFRSMLIAAATQAPEDLSEAGKKVWDHYYCNHQKAGSFKKLRVLDCFMGGGTTLVEGSRLGMQMTGVDLNPVAWFVVKNELACSDPDQVKALFDHIEARVKPQVQPFYTTTCPRGHKGRWIDNATGQGVDVDPLTMPVQERERYSWEGPEVIYTFWAKHGPCLAKGCGHRTPIFRSPVVAEKKLSCFIFECACPACGKQFDAELGQTRMAPGSDRVVLDSETAFTELSQPFAQLLKNYDKGKAADTIDRICDLKDLIEEEPGLKCPDCGAFAGKRMAKVLDNHTRTTSAALRKKKEFKLKRKRVQMYLLIHPAWLKGAPGSEDDKPLGGWAGAPAEDTAAWYKKRLENLALVEVRGKSLPGEIELADGTLVDTEQGTIPKLAAFTCNSCGKNQKRLDATRKVGHTAPTASYALQCHCPQCESEGYLYGGRFFKAPDAKDIHRMKLAEREWEKRKNSDLSSYWPRMEIAFSMRTHIKDPLPAHGYTHWWKMFNTRQLLVHTHLLKSITEAPDDAWPLDVKEQALGVLQQYLRNQNSFCFWDIGYDKLVPFMSNANYNPKNLLIENCVFHNFGRGNWESSVLKCQDSLNWVNRPWECVLLPETEKAKSIKAAMKDPVVPGSEPYCASSTDLAFFDTEKYDLIITDPPFGNNLYYADCSDFFYAWMRIPLQKWYAGLPDADYFTPERTPHSMEAIDNPAEHPDDREPFEKVPFAEGKYLKQIQELAGDNSVKEKDPNPFYRPEPASDFYSQTLSACWAEAGRLLKDGGIMAFTFHHSEDQAWIDVLKALFDAGYVLVQTYPIRSDESKGDSGQFGSKKIEYDIIHVCRKRLDKIEPVSWVRMRRWVKEESSRLKELLEHTHGKELPESDLRVILRGKSLEFYSRHYGQVFTGDGQILDVREALLGINQLLDDLLEDTGKTGGLRPPDNAEPTSRLFLRIFAQKDIIPRDELHKTLRGTGISQGDLESRGWVRLKGKEVHVVPVQERFAFFIEPGRNRKVIKTDLDQAWFLIGAAAPDSGIKINSELNNPNFAIKKSTDEILKWICRVSKDPGIRQAAHTAVQLVSHWRSGKDRPKTVQLSLFDTLEENE